MNNAAQPISGEHRGLVPSPPNAIFPIRILTAEPNITSHQGAEAGNMKAKSSPISTASKLSMRRGRPVMREPRASAGNRSRGGKSHGPQRGNSPVDSCHDHRRQQRDKECHVAFQDGAPAMPERRRADSKKRILHDIRLYVGELRTSVNVWPGFQAQACALPDEYIAVRDVWPVRHSRTDLHSIHASICSFTHLS